jgi:Membrane bound FAD containing D-sorbitol dehydrogenase
MAEKPDNQLSNELIDANNEDIFLQLSQLLTGVDKLDPNLAKEYYHEYLQQRFGIYLDELMGIYQRVVAAAEQKPLDQKKVLEEVLGCIKKDSQVLHVAKQVVRIWYISQFKESSDPSINTEVYAGHWREGILWNIIKAHAPAYSDKPHGYWADPPEGV